MKFEPSESEAIKRELARISARAKYEITLQSLVNGWMSFVIRVEDGYGLTIYDYENDLSKRSIIEEIMNNIPSLREQLEREVQPFDLRFKNATTESDQVSDGGGNLSWVRRIPKKLEGELADDLRDRN
jgi:hypothetical protein